MVKLGAIEQNPKFMLCNQMKNRHKRAKFSGVEVRFSTQNLIWLCEPKLQIFHGDQGEEFEFKHFLEMQKIQGFIKSKELFVWIGGRQVTGTHNLQGWNQN